MVGAVQVGMISTTVSRAKASAMTHYAGVAHHREWNRTFTGVLTLLAPGDVNAMAAAPTRAPPTTVAPTGPIVGWAPPPPPADRWCTACC